MIRTCRVPHRVVVVRIFHISEIMPTALREQLPGCASRRNRGQAVPPTVYQQDRGARLQKRSGWNDVDCVRPPAIAGAAKSPVPRRIGPGGGKNLRHFRSHAGWRRPGSRPGPVAEACSCASSRPYNLPPRHLAVIGPTPYFSIARTARPGASNIASDSSHSRSTTGSQPDPWNIRMSPGRDPGSVRSR